MSCKPLFIYIKEKHGTPILQQCRGFGNLIICYEKAQLDLQILLTCKKEGLVDSSTCLLIGVLGSRDCVTILWEYITNGFYDHTVIHQLQCATR